MLFERRLRDGLVDGSISLAFRRWRRPQVVAGHRFRLGAGAGMVLVTSVDIVSSVTADDARMAGFSSVDALRKDLPDLAGSCLYRIRFGQVGADPRDVLRQSDDDFANVDRRLERMATSRPLDTLALIGQKPGVRAADLKDILGGWPDLHQFKQHVRKLKELGLTISLVTGYCLSPRGEAYVRLRKS